MPAQLPPHANASAPGVLILDRNLPDPAVLEVGGRFYLYSSQTGFSTPPVSLTTSRGTSLFHWNKTGTALANVPSWAETGFTWAPDVRFIDGRYVLYFNAWAEKSMFFLPQETGFSQRAQCIGVATATTPGGPFTPVAGPPLVCQFDHHGAIDPRSFLAADGQLYLDWKSDDNASPGSPPTHIWAQELSSDGERLVGARHLLDEREPSHLERWLDRSARHDLRPGKLLVVLLGLVVQHARLFDRSGKVRGSRGPVQGDLVSAVAHDQFPRAVGRARSPCSTTPRAGGSCTRPGPSTPTTTDRSSSPRSISPPPGLIWKGSPPRHLNRRGGGVLASLMASPSKSREVEMTRALITGITGQDGRHLAEFLAGPAATRSTDCSGASPTRRRPWSKKRSPNSNCWAETCRTCRPSSP